MPQSPSNSGDPMRGLNEAAAPGEKEALGGTGGSAGGGTRSGRGEPAGSTTDRGPGAEVQQGGPPDIGESSDEQIAREAGALGSVDGTLADAGGDGKSTAGLAGGPVDGESVGAGASRGEAGSGPPKDRGGLGGGGPLGQQGGSGPAGSDGGNL